jgi:predicted P-loop ATPase
MDFNINEAERFLRLLGKNGASRLRAFWPRNKPVPEGTPRAFRGTFSTAAREAPGWVKRGLGVYAVIGNGGDSDDAITDCPALFIEWDDRPKAQQLGAWQTYGLPEPTFTVDTGGKSMHLYWVLNEPISPERFRDLIGRLIDHTGADRLNRNPSRVMRLPGAWHFSWDEAAGKVRRNGQTAIVQESGMRYDADLFDALLPQAEQTERRGQPAIEVPFIIGGFEELPPRPPEALLDAMQMVPEFSHDQDRFEELVRLTKRLHMDLGREDALDLMRHHSPHIKDMEGYFVTAPSKLSPGSIWPFLRENYGVDIRRHDLKRRSRESAAPPQAARQEQPAEQAAGADQFEEAEPAQQRQGGINTDLEMKQKPKLRSIPPHEVKAQLPQRLGGIPRLNIRTNDFEAGGKVYTADDAGRLYVHLCSEAERWPSQATFDVFVELAKDRAFDPVEEELNRLGKTVEPLPMEQWERLDWHLLGINDPIAAKFLPQFLLSAVARVFRPGCGVRRSPVLIGPQWRGKTKLGAILFGQAHWIENVTDLGKDDLLRLQSAWGVELSELDGITRRKDQEALKAFLTATQDAFRAPYAKATTKHDRRCVFWGTANGPPLRDLSGSTRFVCIKLPDQMLPLDWARENRAAIWSRAVAIYRQAPADKEPWDHSTEEERKAIEERNANHQETDPWAEEIAQHLRAATDRPVSVAYLLDRMDIPKGQRNNAMAARVRQLAEAVGWVMERRRPIGSDEKKQGLWPANPLAVSTGHPGHPLGTSRGAQGKGSQEQGSDDFGHPGHPYSTKVDREINREEEHTCAQPFDAFGVPGVPTGPDAAPGQGSGWAPRADFGVPKPPIRGAQPAQRRVQAREPGPLPPGIYLVTSDPGGFRMEVFGPEDDPSARRMAIDSDDIQPID